MTRIFSFCVAVVLCLSAHGAHAQSSQSRLNYGVLLYGQKNFDQAEKVFSNLPSAAAKLWLSRTQLQTKQYRQAVETATAARAAGLSASEDKVAARVQLAAIRLGKLQSEYPDLARDLGIKGERPYSFSAGADIAHVSGLLKEFDVNGDAVRDTDLRLSLTASGAYKLPSRPLQFQPVVGYRFTHRHFFENDGFNQQNHQPFVSVSRRATDDLSVSLRLDHTTSLSGAGLDLFVRQFGVGGTFVWRDQPRHLVRGGYSVTYSDFNDANGDDNVTNAIFVARSIQDTDAPKNLFTYGLRAALVSAEAQTSGHGLISLFASRQFEVKDWAKISLQGSLSRAHFNQDDTVQNIRRKDNTVSASISAERELSYGLIASGQFGVTRVISTIDRIDRTSAVASIGLRKKF